MQAPIFDSAVRQIAVVSISGYQKYISPKKGFSCAHRVLYGGESCSQYIKRAIAQRGLSQGLKAARHRFAACKNANKILKARYNSQSNQENPNSEDNDQAKSEKETSRRNPKYQNDCGTAASDCGSQNCSGMDCYGADCSGIDCCGADCFGMDCCGADCGSCGSS